MAVSYAVSDPSRNSDSFWLWSEFDFNESSATPLIVLKARSFVLRSIMYVEDLWNAGTPTVKIGSASDNGLLVNGASLAAVGGQAFVSPVVFDGETVVNVYPTHGSSTAGRAIIGFEVLEVPLY